MSEGGATSPPGQKRVVVLREGPPKGRGKVLDGTLGVVGALLILLSALLVNVLPETQVPDPQFRVEYPAVPVELASSVRSVDLFPATDGVLAGGAGNAVDVPYDLEHNNVYEVVLFLSILEDFEESLPDTFRVELLDPQGASVAISSPQQTHPTEEIPDEQKGVGDYFETTQTTPHRITFNVAARPDDAIVTFEDGRNATVEEAEAAIVARDTRPTQGAWTVRVWVEEVGQCPTLDGPTTDPATLRHVQFCTLADQQVHDGEGDTGNPFVLSRLEYTYYDVIVSEA